jgi:hypothetical protein
MEYLVVRFPEPRKVTVDGFISGATGTLLQVDAGPHTIALDPPTGYRPHRQTVVLVGTTALNPSVITFALDPSSS